VSLIIFFDSYCNLGWDDHRGPVWMGMTGKDRTAATEVGKIEYHLRVSFGPQSKMSPVTLCCEDFGFRSRFRFDIKFRQVMYRRTALKISVRGPIIPKGDSHFRSTGMVIAWSGN